MRFFLIGIAGKKIGITAEFTRMYNISRSFITEGEPDFYIQCSMEDYDVEANTYEALYHREAPSDVYLEECAMLRKVSEELVEYKIILMHGAAIAINNSAYVFTAPSGTGKTTHIMKWLKNLPDTFVVNGDKPFIKINEDGTPPLVCGSPWSGKESLYTNTMVPLKSIIIMERAEDNNIEQISLAEAFPWLLQQVYRPNDPDKMRKTLNLIQSLSPAISFWHFQCNNFKDGCFELAYNALVRNQK